MRGSLGNRKCRAWLVGWLVEWPSIPQLSPVRILLHVLVCTLIPYSYLPPLASNSCCLFLLPPTLDFISLLYLFTYKVRLQYYMSLFVFLVIYSIHLPTQLPASLLSLRYRTDLYLVSVGLELSTYRLYRYLSVWVCPFG